MSMTILTKARGYSNAIFYDPTFRKVLEDHLELLASSSVTARKTITQADANKYKWNITAFLNTVVQPDWVWLTMRLNGFEQDLDYDGTKTTFLIPGSQDIDDIVSRYLTLVGV